MAIVLSKGNIKIKDTLIFNLPTVRTCPFATEACKAFCYAAKAERQYPQVLPSRERHFEVSMQIDFVDRMIVEISKMNKSGKYKYFRIHESGDFYNQTYLNKWIEIAKAFPAIKFLAYTKSHPLDFSNKPDNMIIRYSIDSTSKAIRTDMPLAIVQDPNNETTSKNGKQFDCKQGMKCHECRVCWNSNVTVNFQVH